MFLGVNTRFCDNEQSTNLIKAIEDENIATNEKETISLAQYLYNSSPEEIEIQS